MSNFKKKKYLRDAHLAYLINGARRTIPEGYPVIEKWMVSKTIPKFMTQWDKRSEVSSNVGDVCMSFYCDDWNFTPVLDNPRNYVEKLKKYQSIIGMDASPYDNMPLVIQQNQIYVNLAITYYYGSKGIKVIPNVRLGSNETLNCLAAYPKETIIGIGTNGFTKEKNNRKIFKNQVSVIVDTLRPTHILVYGPYYDEVFISAKEKDIPIYVYDSYMQIKNRGMSIHEG